MRLMIAINNLSIMKIFKFVDEGLFNADRRFAVLTKPLRADFRDSDYERTQKCLVCDVLLVPTSRRILEDLPKRGVRMD